VSAILLNTQTNLFSQTHTHALLRNSWRFNRQQLTGYRWEGHSLFKPIHPLNPQHTALVLLILNFLHIESNTHTYRHTCLYHTGTVINPSSTAAYLFLMAASPVSLSLPLGFLSAANLLVLSESLITSANVSIHCVSSKQNVQMATESRGSAMPAFWSTSLFSLSNWKWFLFL